MRTWTDETTGCKMCEPDCADEWLFDIWAIGCDYDGESTVDGLKKLVDRRISVSESCMGRTATKSKICFGKNAISTGMISPRIASVAPVASKQG